MNQVSQILTTAHRRRSEDITCKCTKHRIHTAYNYGTLGSESGLKDINKNLQRQPAAIIDLNTPIQVRLCMHYTSENYYAIILFTNLKDKKNPTSIECGYSQNVLMITRTLYYGEPWILEATH